MKIEWDTPPEKQKREGKWQEVFDQLRDNPGKWAKLYESKDRNAHSLAGRLRAQFGSDYEVRSQLTGTKNGVKQAGVWARYQPEEEEIVAIEEAVEEEAVEEEVAIEDVNAMTELEKMERELGLTK